MSAKLSQDELIEIEAYRLELAQRHTQDFAAYVDPDAADNYGARHLRLIGEYMDKAMLGTLWDDVPGHGAKILIITTPPRHWKSSFVSQKCAAFFIGRRFTDKQPHAVILASYGASLAEKNSEAVLGLVRDNPRYHKLFPRVAISKTSQSKQAWTLVGQSFPACKASGVGGPLTGEGADMLIIDDPIKDLADANSLAFRDKLWDWWTGVARTRINPGGFVVVVMTRWHKDDMVGRLINEKETGERIVHLRLPALAETGAERLAAEHDGLPIDPADPLGRKAGEALWPEMYSRDALLVTKRQYAGTFRALYQGRPGQDGGNMIGREAFRLLKAEPTSHIKWVLAADFALTEKEQAPKRGHDPDFTAIVKMGLWEPVAGEARLVLSWVRKGQLGPNDALELVRRALVAEPRGTRLRSGQANVDALYLAQLRREPALLGYSIRNVDKKVLRGDKVTLATPWIEMAQAGLFYVVENGAGVREFLQDVEQFPHGAHDDVEDAISIGAAYFGLATGPQQARNVRMSFYQ